MSRPPQSQFQASNSQEKRLAELATKSAQGQLTVTLPRPLPHQISVMEADARFKVVIAGRRWGKTILGLISVNLGHGPMENGRPKYRGALNGGNIWWVAPTYTIANLIWRDLKRALQDIWLDKSEVERRIVLPGGGTISVRSTDNPDSLRGAGLDGIVVDEAAYVKEEAWTEALRSALADREGWAIFISTPKGHNWLWRTYRKALVTENWIAWQRPTSDNPKIPTSEIEETRKELGPMVFAQEILAEFVAAGSNQFKQEWFQYFYSENGAFRLVQERLSKGGSVTEIISKVVHPSELFKFQIVDLATSLAQSADFTVVSTFGVTAEGDLLILDVQRKRLEGPDHIPFISEAYEAWQPGYIGIEKAAMGLGVVQAAIRAGLPIKPLAAEKDKVSRAQNILARYSQKTVYHMHDAPWLVDFEDELTAFPNGAHDDQVDTLAYAGILLAERPNKRLLFPRQEALLAAFQLPSQMSGVGSTPGSLSGAIEDSSQTIFARDKELREQFDWLCANGETLDTLLSSLDPSFVGKGIADEPWHVHLSVAPGAFVASLALARISHVEIRTRIAEAATLEVEVPHFTVPLLLRVTMNSRSYQAVDLGALGDFVIALRQIRRFMITSASVAGFHSAALVHRLTRAGLATVGAQVHPTLGTPQGPGTPMTMDRQPYTDLQLAINEGRVQAMKNGWVVHQLAQLEDNGESLSGIKETADALAGAVGYLSRWGHSVLVMPGDDLISYRDLGVRDYDLADPLGLSNPFHDLHVLEESGMYSLGGF